MSLSSCANDEADRGEHGRLAEPVEGRVEKGAEHRALARGASERAVEDVGDRADDEEDAAEPEEEVRVALLEADEHGAGQAERDARHREHVRRQLRLRDAPHRALQDLAGRLRVLLLDPVELADARARAAGVSGHAVALGLRASGRNTPRCGRGDARSRIAIATPATMSSQ